MTDKLYSVIETFEDQKQLFSSCPTSWISGQHVLWPPKGQLYKCRKDFTVPKSSWKNYRIVRIISENIGNKITNHFN